MLRYIIMKKDVIFDELGKKEQKLLLKAFDYNIDKEGFVLTPSGSRIPSGDVPSKYIRAEDAALIPGSLKVIDSTPTAISKFIREEIEDRDASKD